MAGLYAFRARQFVNVCCEGYTTGEKKERLILSSPCTRKTVSKLKFIIRDYFFYLLVSFVLFF